MTAPCTTSMRNPTPMAIFRAAAIGTIAIASSRFLISNAQLQVSK